MFLNVATHMQVPVCWLQGAFRQVATEANACATELSKILKQRMVTQKDDAAECIQMVRKLGEPIESLQVPHFVHVCMAHPQ